MQGNGFWTRACCYRKPPQREGNGSSFVFLKKQNLGTSSAKGADALVNVRVVYLEGALTNPPGDCLGGRRVQVPSQQRVTRYNTCDCTASYLNKGVGCLGEAHARVGACINMTKTKSGAKSESIACEPQLQQSDKWRTNTTRVKVRCSLLLFTQMTTLWRI